MRWMRENIRASRSSAQYGGHGNGMIPKLPLSKLSSIGIGVAARQMPEEIPAYQISPDK